MELRLLAHIADDAALIDAFARDEDIHTRTAAEVFGVPPQEVTSEQRRVAKMVNFGIAYGLSSHGLSTRLDIPEEDARDIIERYFDALLGHQALPGRDGRDGAQDGATWRRSSAGAGPWGTCARRTASVAQAAERAAINMPIQGTAADLMKKAMLDVDAEMKKQGLRTRMLLQVHDELLFEAPPDEVEAVKELARQCMDSVMQLKVPLKVEVGAGNNWADAH